MVPKSGEKDKFYFTVYNITLNSNWTAQRISKNLEKMQKIGLNAKINTWVIKAQIFIFLRRKLCFNVSK